jgi:ribosomal protein S18 acetylase RimI-like enzyme
VGEMESRGADVVIRPFVEADEDAVIALWEAAGLLRPWNNPHSDIARKLGVQRAWFLVASRSDRVVGTVMAGYDGHRGSIYYLAVEPESRGTGVGRTLIWEAERLLAGAGCPKVTVQVRTDNEHAVGFYEALGYSVDDVISLGRRLEHDDVAPGDPL